MYIITAFWSPTKEHTPEAEHIKEGAKIPGARDTGGVDWADGHTPLVR